MSRALLLTACLWTGGFAHAQSPSVPPVAPPPKAVASASSGWNQLTPAQKQALRPLAGTWDSLSEGHRSKWLALSRNYAIMTPAEQSTLHSRMTEWAALSPSQRVQARLNFAETRRISPDEKKAKWEAYQALPPEERSRLAASAPTRPVGAATVAKPVAPRAPVRTVGRPADGASAPQVNENTLLPRKAASTSASMSGPAVPAR